MKIAIFSTCVVDAMFPQAAMATTHLLERLGHTVVFPEGQACCGQMHINTGYFDAALPVVKNHINTFKPVLEGEWDYIVAPSSSCTGSIKHQQGMVLRDRGYPDLAEQAEAIASKTYDLSMFLVDVLKMKNVGAYFPHRVTYHPTCHSLRMLKVGDRPWELLQNVGGIDLVELPEAKSCCGFGGTFAVKNAATSNSMLTDKMTNILSTKAEILVAGDYSCLMNIGGGLSRLRSGVRTMHLAEVLAGTEAEPWNAPSITTTVLGA